MGAVGADPVKPWRRLGLCHALSRSTLTALRRDTSQPFRSTGQGMGTGGCSPTGQGYGWMGLAVSMGHGSANSHGQAMRLARIVGTAHIRPGWGPKCASNPITPPIGFCRRCQY